MSELPSRDTKLLERAKQIDHILLKPETYIGSVAVKRTPQWVLAPEEDRLIHKKIDFIPGLYKILDEALITTAENYHIDRSINTFKFDIEQEKVSIWFNGASAPVQLHHELKSYLPELLYGDFVNVPGFEDHLKQLTGERFFMGFKLANVFSKSFLLETGDSKNKLKFKMLWTDHMKCPSEPEISEFNGSDYTLITFDLDIEKFGLSAFDGDMLSLFKKRICDIAGIISANITVFINNRKISIKGFTNYVDLYLAGRPEKTTVKIQDPETNNFRWQVIATLSDGTFQQVSFVNSICTPNGGTHADLISEQIMFKLFEGLKGKCQMLGLRPHHLRNSFWIFINCLVEEPMFDSPARETLLTKTPRFGSRCRITEKFVRMLVRAGLLTNLATYVQDIPQIKANRLRRKIFKKVKKFTFSKFEDAPNAGEPESRLFIAESEANKQIVTSYLEALPSREHCGVLAMRNKLQNAREPLGPDGVNPEFAVLMKLVGLEIGRQPDEGLMRYSGIIFAVDNKVSSLYFVALVFNFFHLYWPSLLNIPGFFSLLKIQEGNYVLGSLDEKTVLEAFNSIENHLVTFAFEKERDNEAFSLAFQPCLSTSQRSNSYNSLLDDFNRTNGSLQIKMGDKAFPVGAFVKSAAISHLKTELSKVVPCLFDGLNSLQRIVMKALFELPDEEVSVQKLIAKVVSESRDYENSITENAWMSSIVGLAQNFIGSNNFPLLKGLGNFGSRNGGGKDLTPPYLLSVSIPKFSKEIFRKNGDSFICPFPVTLLNGSQTVSVLGPSAIPPCQVALIIEFFIKGVTEYIKTHEGQEETAPKKKKKEKKKSGRNAEKSIEIPFDFSSLELSAEYNFFTGKIERIIPKPIEEYNQPSSSTNLPPQLNFGPNIAGFIQNNASINKSAPHTGFICHGSFKIFGGWLEIRELPIGKWERDYKDFLHSRRDIAEVHEFREGLTVKFYLRMKDPSALQKIEKGEGIARNFRLITHMADTGMFLLSREGKMIKFENLNMVVKEFSKGILLEYTHYKVNEVQRLKSEWMTHELKDLCSAEQIREKFDLLAAQENFSLSFDEFIEEFPKLCSNLPASAESSLEKAKTLQAKRVECLWLEDLERASAAFAEYQKEQEERVSFLRSKQIGFKPIEAFCNPNASLAEKKSPLPNALMNLNGPFLDAEGSEDMSFDEETYSQDSLMMDDVNNRLEEENYSGEQGMSFEVAQMSFGEEFPEKSGKYNKVELDNNGKVEFSAVEHYTAYN